MKWILTALLFTVAVSGQDTGSRQDAMQFRKECAKLAEGAKIMTVKGKDGWLFLRNELRHIGVGKFWGPAAAKVSRATNPTKADPFEAIVDYNKQCKKWNVELILLPIPPKAVIYPEKITSANVGEKPVRLDIYHRQFYQELRAKGVNVVDLTDIFLAKRYAKSGNMYCKQDTHFSGEACVVAAQILAEQIKKKPWYQDVPKKAITAEKQQVQIAGDLRRALEDDTVEKETLPLTQVKLDGRLITKDPDSPVLLFGDSHCLVFHIGGEMHAKSSGLADQLANELKFGIDDLGVRGSGAYPARANLYRRAKKGDYLAKKKVLIWCFTAREFTEADRWGKVPLKRGR